MDNEPNSAVPPEEAASMVRIACVRNLCRRAAQMTAKHSAVVEEMAIGAVFAAYDLAELHAGPGANAVEFMRSACDLFEKTLMSGAGREMGPRW